MTPCVDPKWIIPLACMAIVGTISVCFSLAQVIDNWMEARHARKG